MTDEDGLPQLPLMNERLFPAPPRYHTNATMKTWKRTVVFHNDGSETTYPNGGDPDLHPSEGDFFVEFSSHGEDGVVRYRLVPVGGSGL